MSDVYLLEALKHYQLVLSSVTAVCAAVGISFAAHDWKYWRMQPAENDKISYSSSIPMFVLVCLTALFYTPVRFSNIMDDFELSPTATGIFRSIALTFLLIYFYIAAVRRYRAFDLPQKEARRKSFAIFLGMTLLAIVGFYGK